MTTKELQNSDTLIDRHKVTPTELRTDPLRQTRLFINTQNGIQTQNDIQTHNGILKRN